MSAAYWRGMFPDTGTEPGHTCECGRKHYSEDAYCPCEDEGDLEDTNEDEDD